MLNRVLTGMLIAAGWAVAAPAGAWSWTGTLADWAASSSNTGVILDGHADMSFTLSPGYTLTEGTGAYVTISEVEVGGNAYYDIGINWTSDTGFVNAYSGGGSLAYTLTRLGTDRIVSGALDTVVINTGTTATMQLKDVPSSTTFASFTSTNGSHDPLVGGYTTFAGRSAIEVLQVWQTSATGAYQNTHASFLVAVPEPAPAAMLGLGLLALALRRRQMQGARQVD